MRLNLYASVAAGNWGCLVTKLFTIIRFYNTFCVMPPTFIARVSNACVLLFTTGVGGSFIFA